MRQPVYEETWPEDRKDLYKDDLLEVFGDNSNRSHTCMFKLRHRKTLDLVLRYCDQGASVLDVGAAQGNFSLALAEAGYKVTWNDLLANRAGYVKLKYSAGEVRYRAGNVFALPFHKDFNCVLATEIIEHVAHPDEFVQKLSEFVKTRRKDNHYDSKWSLRQKSASALVDPCRLRRSREEAIPTRCGWTYIRAARR